MILGEVIFQNRVSRQAGPLHDAGLPDALISELSSGNIISSIAAVQGLASPEQAIVKVILTVAFREVWIFYTVVALLGAVSSLCIKSTKLS